MLTPKKTRATVVPCLRYRDAPAAIDWLCRVFGFEKHLVVNGDHGSIHHAELSFGNGMVMVGSAPGSPLDPAMKQSGEAAEPTQTSYLIVSDADAVYARARAAGAQIVSEIGNEDHGGRGFTCRDPEGRLWSIGTYDPWSVPGGT
jgi:uncharacterized glyoxalase superfamily protein PhnB